MQGFSSQFRKLLTEVWEPLEKCSWPVCAFKSTWVANLRQSTSSTPNILHLSSVSFVLISEFFDFFSISSISAEIGPICSFRFSRKSTHSDRAAKIWLIRLPSFLHSFRRSSKSSKSSLSTKSLRLSSSLSIFCSLWALFFWIPWKLSSSSDRFPTESNPKSDRSLICFSRLRYEVVRPSIRLLKSEWPRSTFSRNSCLSSNAADIRVQNKKI